MSDSGFAQTPQPPYYAVMFTSQRNDQDPQGYAATADRMLELARQQPGYLGVESVRDANGFGITISYWESQDAISQWRAHGEHRVAQEQGKLDWYEHFEARVAVVERAWGKR